MQGLKYYSKDGQIGSLSVKSVLNKMYEINVTVALILTIIGLPKYSQKLL